MSVILERSEKRAYLEALIYIATIEDGISEEEKQFYFDIGQRYGLDQAMIEESWNEIQDIKSIEEVLQPIIRRETKLMLTYELVTMCYADGKYSELEKDGMKRICSILDIEDEKLKQIEEVIVESIEVQQKTLNILERVV